MERKLDICFFTFLHFFSFSLQAPEYELIDEFERIFEKYFVEGAPYEMYVCQQWKDDMIANRYVFNTHLMTLHYTYPYIDLYTMLNKCTHTSTDPHRSIQTIQSPHMTSHL